MVDLIDLKSLEAQTDIGHLKGAHVAGVGWDYGRKITYDSKNWPERKQ